MTPRRSVRARVRAIYGEMAEGEAGGGAASPSLTLPRNRGRGKEEAAPSSLRYAGQAPTPNPSPQGGGEQTEQAAGVEGDLTARIRALYETSAVPVREIARIAGVTERTLYKYVAKGGWKRRYQVLPRGEAAAAANRGRRWRIAPDRNGDVASDFVPAKGAGGRFIRREDKGKPFATGLKATDPAARARAEAACAAASARHAEARAKADQAQVWEARRRAIDTVSAAMEGYNRWRRTRLRRWGRPFYMGGPGDAEMEADRRMEALYIGHIQAAIDVLNKPPE